MRRVSQRSVECAIVGGPALVVFVWWTLHAGGYFARDWMPGTLLLLVVGAASAIGRRRDMAWPPRAACVALSAFAGYVAWSFLSILWAGTPADALEGSQRALAYLVCFAVFALLPWTPRVLLASLLAVVATLTVIAIVTLARLTDDAPLAERFVDGSLLGPIGYHNASAALFAMAAAPALVLAARRELATWLRPLLLAAATLLLGLAALGQSRGLLLTAPIVVLVAVLLSPDRMRLTLFAMPVIGGLALAAADILAVGRAGSGVAPADAEATIRPALELAVTKVALATAITLAAATGLVALERRWSVGKTLDPGLRRRLAAGCAVVALLGAAGGALAATRGQPLDRIQTAWTQFADVEYADSTSTGLGSGRYDFWRVAVVAWRAHPLLGLGQDNFIEYYARAGRTDEEPRWVHSLPLRLLAHTGLVGAALFATFLLAVGCGLRRAWRALDSPAARAVVGAACLPPVVWLAHGSVDWLWEVPAVSLVALALAGALVSLSGREDGDAHATAERPRRAQRRIAAAAVVAAAAGSAIILPAFVADREVALAAQVGARDPAGAYAHLATAASLNPLSADPGLTQGAVAIRHGDLQRARAGFADAARHSPDAWYPRFALGLVASAGRDRAEAERQLRAARQRNPREQLIADALARLNGSHPLGFAEAQRRRDAARRIQRRQDR